MDLSTNGLVASLLVGSVGMAFFLYGKKQARLPQLAGGVALMVFPYFVGAVGWMLLVAGLIVALTWAAVRAGW